MMCNFLLHTPRAVKQTFCCVCGFLLFIYTFHWSLIFDCFALRVFHCRVNSPLLNWELILPLSDSRLFMWPTLIKLECDSQGYAELVLLWCFRLLWQDSITLFDAWQLSSNAHTFRILACQFTRWLNLLSRTLVRCCLTLSGMCAHASAPFCWCGLSNHCDLGPWQCRVMFRCAHCSDKQSRT